MCCLLYRCKNDHTDACLSCIHYRDTVKVCVKHPSNTSKTRKAKKEKCRRGKDEIDKPLPESMREEYTSRYQFSMVLQPLLDCRAECAVRDKISVCKLEVCHRRSIVATLEPSSQGLCFVSESICRNLWILHDFLQDQTIEMYLELSHSKPEIQMGCLPSNCDPHK